MINQNIERIFNPESIAVIGASRDPKSVGYGILKNLVTGCVFTYTLCKQFTGKIYPINPNADKILGLNCYSSILNIKEKIDLAIIAVPAKIVPKIVQESVKKRVAGIIIISAGFAELGKEGEKLQNQILDIIKKTDIRLIGPNCLGIILPHQNLNASFAPSMPPPGNVAFITQSGALADSIIDWSIEERYGFSALISVGNAADLDIPDYLEFLEKDEQTKAIAIYLEGLKDGKRFMEIAKKVSKSKPIMALKAGRTEKAKQAISSHTGSLAGSYQIFEAAFKQSNVLITDTVEELFDNAKALANLPPCKNNIAIVTNGGGCGVLCADYCSQLGINLIELKKSTIKKLDKTGQMHPAYSKTNPLDIIGDALPERYEAAINTLLEEDYINGLIVIQTLQTMTSSEDDAKVVIEARKKFPQKPIICNYMGGKFSRKGRLLLESNNIPDFNDTKKAALAMKALIERYNQLNQ